jgi:hypothetical protein
MSETAMILGRKISVGMGRCLVLTALVATIGCAEDYGNRDSTATNPNSTTEKTAGDQKTAPQTAQTEDVRFVATEEQNSKMWKASGPTSTAAGGNTVSLNLKNRGSKPLTFKVVNMLSGEHGFAIDSMKVQTLLQPGEEKTITVPLENIDSSVSEHRAYCQLHPKHMAAALVVLNDQNTDITKATRPADGAQGTAAGDSTRMPQASDQSQRKGAQDSTEGSIATGSQTGEASSRITGESEGQRVIREQSQRQREIESTSRSEQAPGSIDAKGCEGFPGFDRGCPGSSNRTSQP